MPRQRAQKTKRRTARKTRKQVRRYNRKEVRIAKNIAEFIKREYEAWRSAYHGDNDYPEVFLLGENGRHTVTDLVRLLITENGCDQMPNVTQEAMTNGYIYLAQKGLTPCAILRIGQYFEDSGELVPESGPDVFQKNIDYILTYDGSNSPESARFMAHTVYDKDFHISQMDYDSDEYHEFKQNLKNFPVVFR